MPEAIGWEPWRALAEKALAGAPFETLQTRLDDGLGGAILLDPLMPAAEPVFAGRPTAGPWLVVGRVDTDRGAAAQAREDLENGATALSLVFAGAPGAYGRGLTARDPHELNGALDGVRIELIPVQMEVGARAREALAMTLALLRSRGVLPVALHAGLDPLGAYAAGAPLRHWFGQTGELADAVRGFVHLDIDGTALTADGRVVAEAGGSAVEELAFAVGAMVEYVTALAGEGLAPATTLPRIAMALTATQDQFATIAKLRAARRLQRLVATSCDVGAPLTLHVTTAQRMLAVTDPHTNLLRLTIAAFAAGVGGADALAVLPFDEAATPFGRRLARNIQNLLLEEAHIARHQDAGAGSGAIEALTDSIAAAAWALVQSRAGRSLADHIADGALRPAAAPATPVVIGVTKHPPRNPAVPLGLAAVEPPGDRLLAVTGSDFAALVRAAEMGSSIADLEATADPVCPAPAEPLRAARASAAFEAI